VFANTGTLQSNITTANTVNATVLSVNNGVVIANSTGVTTTGGISASGNVVAANVYANSGTIRGSLLQGTIVSASASQPNITQVGTLNTLQVSNRITADNIVSNSTVSGTRLIATAPNGTSPFTVSSNTLVANLNADLLDGQTTATGATPNTIVSRDSGANITANGATFSSQVTFNESRANISPFSVASSVKVNNLNADLLDGFSAEVANSSSTVVVRDAGGNITGRDFTGQRYISTTTTGTAPFVVSSTTVVPNLNVSLLGGLGLATAFAAQPNTVVSRNATGQIAAGDIIASGQYISNVTGTAPLSVVSNVQVANLNVELHNGYRSNTQNFPNTVVVRDGNGIMAANTLNLANTITAINGNITNLNVINNANVGGSLTTNGNISMNGGILYAGNANMVVDKITANVLDALLLNVSGFANGTSNVTIPVVDGNINFSVANTRNVYVMSTNTFSTTANIISTRSITADTLVTANGTSGRNIRLGDDVFLGDVNRNDTVGIRGFQNFDAGWVTFGANTTRRIGRYPGGNVNPIIIEGGATVSKKNTDDGESQIAAGALLRLESSRSASGIDDQGEVYLSSARGNGTGSAAVDGTMTVSRFDGGYGAITFGSQNYDHSLARIGTGPLTWGGNWSFKGLTSNDSGVFISNLQIGNASNLSVNTITANTGTVGNIEIGYRYFPTANLASGANYTLQLSDSSRMYHQVGNESNVFVPTNANVQFPVGTVIMIYNSSAAAVNIRPQSGVTLVQSGSGIVSSFVRVEQWGQASVMKFDTNRWTIIGAGIVGI
jgi:hypothetical protein